jgi:hypothetical protein
LPPEFFFVQGAEMAMLGRFSVLFLGYATTPSLINPIAEELATYINLSSPPLQFQPMFILDPHLHRSQS